MSFVYAVLLADLAHAGPLRGPDFDGDGHEDAAIAAHLGDPGGVLHAGSVHVMYGSGDGLAPASGGRTADLYRDAPGVTGVAAEHEYFGYALAWGDFDDDCYDDLAVGVPGVAVGGVSSAGGVLVFHGSSSGPSTSGEVWFDRNTAGIALGPEEEAAFGATLAVGDFDGDGRDDLAIGAPFDGFDNDGEGEVHVLYGAAGVGLEAAGSQLVTNPGGLHFGAALAAGDFNCDGYDDLAIDQLTGAYYGTGQLLVLYGSATGLDEDHPVPAQAWDPSEPGFLDELEYVEFMGSRVFDMPGATLMAGNFDGNTSGGRACDDLAIGIPGQDLGDVHHPGVVAVMYGTPDSGLQADSPAVDVWDAAGLGFDATHWDQFGWTLATGLFDGDAYEDLAVAARGPGSYRGSLVVIRGGPSGLVSAGAVRWDRDSAVLPGSGHDYDDLGFGLGAGDYDGNGVVDPLIGLPGAALGALSSAGFVMAGVTADAATPTLDAAVAWTLDDVGAQSASAFERFGGVITGTRRASTCGPGLPGGGLGW